MARRNLLIAFFATLFAGLFAFGGCLILARVQTPTQSTVSRDEFRAAVLNKTPDEVLAAVGRPDETTETGTQRWYYRYRTHDPITGNVDRKVQVVFENGMVARVNY